jgi:hypothetical protein
MSADGRYIAFQSYASDLVPDDDNGTSDVFVRDLELGECLIRDIRAIRGHSDLVAALKR